MRQQPAEYEGLTAARYDHIGATKCPSRYNRPLQEGGRNLLMARGQE